MSIVDKPTETRVTLSVEKDDRYLTGFRPLLIDARPPVDRLSTVYRHIDRVLTDVLTE